MLLVTTMFSSILQQLSDNFFHKVKGKIGLNATS